MLKKSWFFLTPLVASMLWLGSGPAQAAGPSWIVTGVEAIGCAENDWFLDVRFSGLEPSGGYIAHTTVTAGGLVYMNQDSDVSSDGDGTWGLFGDNSYGPTTGTWPIPSGTQMKVVFSLEKPKGTVLSSWTMIARKCDSGTLLYNAADRDGDGVPDPTSVTAQDRCPTLASATANGCPVRSRSLTLAAKSGPRRVVGKLDAPGYPALDAGRTVTIWKKKPGPDRQVALRTTRADGTFKATVGKGRYYATSPGVIVPTAGEAAADTSATVRVH